MHLLRRAIALAAVAWALALPLAAFTASHPVGGSGAEITALAVYALGGVLCHQQPGRSFHLWGVQMPVCARCVGIYAGAAFAALAAIRPAIHRPTVRGTTARGATVRFEADSPYPPETARRVLVAAAAPTVLTLLYEWVASDTPANWIRAGAGLVLGGAATVLILSVARNRVD